MVVWHDWKPWTSWTSWLRGHLAEFQNSANSASVQKAICRSLPDWDNFLVELVEFCNSTNTKHKCEHNIGRFLLKYFYKCPSVNRADHRQVKKFSPFCKFLTWPGFFIINPELHLLKPGLYLQHYSFYSLAIKNITIMYSNLVQKKSPASYFDSLAP